MKTETKYFLNYFHFCFQCISVSNFVRFPFPTSWPLKQKNQKTLFLMADCYISIFICKAMRFLALKNWKTSKQNLKLQHTTEYKLKKSGNRNNISSKSFLFSVQFTKFAPKLCSCLRYELAVPSIGLIKYLLVYSSFRIERACHCVLISHQDKAVCVEAVISTSHEKNAKKIRKQKLRFLKSRFSGNIVFDVWCTISCTLPILPRSFSRNWLAKRVEESVCLIHYFIVWYEVTATKAFFNIENIQKSHGAKSSE